MKICYLADANSVHTKKWCDFFKNKGYDITVISLNPGNIDGINIYSLGYNWNELRHKSEFQKIGYLLKIGKIKKIIKKIKPDILHAHYASSYGLLGSLLNYHPFVLSVWGSDIYDFPNKNFLNRAIIKYNLSKADVILSTSKVMADEIRKYTSKPIQITPFGVDVNFFKPETPKKIKNKITIGTIKTLEKKYGIDYLIKAFAIVDKRLNREIEMELIIGGQGSQLGYLIELTKELGIEQKVTFTGFLSGKELVETYNKFDIAVFPSIFDSESFGVAAVEAQACGIPVIVSNVGGLPEATQPGKSSLVVEKENVEQLADAIEKLVKNKELREEMGRAGREYVINNYSINDNLGKVDEIYQNLYYYKNGRKNL